MNNGQHSRQTGLISSSHLSLSLSLSPAACGNPPTGDGVTFTVGPPSATDTQGDIVANEGAIATYDCEEASDIPQGMTQLSCTANGDGSFDWSPSMAPTCIPGMYHSIKPKVANASKEWAATSKLEQVKTPFFCPTRVRHRASFQLLALL